MVARHLLTGIALAVAALVVARLVRLSAADLGLARERWRAGLQWGGAAAVLVLTAYAVASVVVDDVGDPRYDTWPKAVVAALILIPLGTVIPEELVFRGVLWGLAASGARHTRRDRGVVDAVRSVARRCGARRRPGERCARRRCRFGR